VREFKDALCARLKSIPDTVTPESRLILNKVLKCLGEVETPRSLQDMARRVVTRAMLHRCLHACSTLGIAVHQEKYVLLND